MTINWIEWLGYAASILVAISLLMSSLVKLRYYNLVGSILFSIYGFFIGATPVGFINLFIVFINIYYLSKMSKEQEYFKIVNISNNNQYLDYFLQFYKEEIDTYFPNFSLPNLMEKQDSECYYILRDTTPTGIFAGYRWGNDYFMINLDFVTPQYRDFKTGLFIFEDNKESFTEKGYKYFCTANTSNQKHIAYLKKMGFSQKEIDNTLYFVKNI